MNHIWAKVRETLGADYEAIVTRCTRCKRMKEDVGATCEPRQPQPSKVTVLDAFLKGSK